MRVLIAEDDELMLKIVEFRLKKDGHEVILARDGNDALQKVEDYEPDLIISDVMMPYRSGLEIVAAVKEKHETPIIILSGMGHEDMVLEAFRLGADDYLTKPFSPSELSVRIKRFGVAK
ncbi:response regulator transcription factor [Pedobacter terrae]|uniref:response regulator transcription factor n=1 Tax=Pedobacter terrae TaxID=405671 RepID=UPI002FF44876